MANTTWADEDKHWRDSYGTRPYGQGMDYNVLQPGYRYGYEAANRYPGKAWNDVEPELERDWDRYEYRGTSTWQQVKAAARDAWDRMTGRHSTTM